MERMVSQAMVVHRSPNTRDPKRTTPRHIIIKMAKIKDKDRVVKATRKRKRTCTKENPSGYHQISHQKPYKPEGNGMIYSM